MLDKGRRIKRKYARTEFLKVRISPEHLDLLARILEEDRQHSTIISQADIVERGIEIIGADRFLYVGTK